MEDRTPSSYAQQNITRNACCSASCRTWRCWHTTGLHSLTNNGDNARLRTHHYQLSCPHPTPCIGATAAHHAGATPITIHTHNPSTTPPSMTHPSIQPACCSCLMHHILHNNNPSNPHARQPTTACANTSCYQLLHCNWPQPSAAAVYSCGCAACADPSQNLLLCWKVCNLPSCSYAVHSRRPALLDSKRLVLPRQSAPYTAAAQICCSNPTAAVHSSRPVLLGSEHLVLLRQSEPCTAAA